MELTYSSSIKFFIKCILYNYILFNTKRFSYSHFESKLFKSKKIKDEIYFYNQSRYNNNYKKICKYIITNLEKLNNYDNCLLLNFKFIHLMKNPLTIAENTNIVNTITYNLKTIVNKLNSFKGNKECYSLIFNKFKSKINGKDKLNIDDKFKIFKKISKNLGIQFNINFNKLIKKRFVRSSYELKLSEFLDKKQFFDSIINNVSLPIKNKDFLELDLLCLKIINNKLYKICIEIDGKQHWNPNHFLSKNKFLKSNKLDKIKNNYFLHHNISFIRIKHCILNDKHLLENIIYSCFAHLKLNKPFFYTYHNKHVDNFIIS